MPGRPVLLFLAVLIAACAVVPADTREADEALRGGHYERALALYEAELDRRPHDRLLKEKRKLARRRATDAHLDAARRAEREGDLALAVDHLGWAGVYSPKSPKVAEESYRVSELKLEVVEKAGRASRLLDEGRAAEALPVLTAVSAYGPTVPGFADLLARAEATAARAEAARLVQEGDSLLADGHPLKALTAYEQAHDEDPSLAAAVLGRDRARRAAAGLFLARAREAEAGGEPGAALVALAEAREALGEDPDLAEGAKGVRQSIWERLLSAIETHRAAGRLATAALLARAAAKVVPETDALLVAEADRELADSVTVTVEVQRFADETGGRLDPRSFTADLLSALAEATPGPWISFAIGLTEADVTVDGEVTELAVSEEEPQAERKVEERLLRVEQEPNPARAKAYKDLRRLDSRLSDAQRTWRAARDELDSLERLSGSAQVRSGTRRYGRYSEAAYYRLLGNARHREAVARQARDRVGEQVEEARRRHDDTPLYLERQVFGKASYEAVTRTKTARAAASFRVRPAEIPAMAAVEPFEKTVSVIHTARDVSHGGHRETDLPPDPDEMPDDVKLAGQALSELADRLAEAVTAHIGAWAVTLISDARSFEAQGKTENALDRYVAFALTAGPGFELERANALEVIRKHWGIELGPETIDIRGMRYR